MFTLAWIRCQYNCCFILLLESSKCLGSMVWKPDMNRKKSPIIWKMNLSQKVPGMRVENCQKNVKKNNFQSSLLEVFLKKHCVEVSFQISLPTATLFFRHSYFPFCELSGRLLLSIAVLCQEHFKLNVRRMTYPLNLMTPA